MCPEKHERQFNEFYLQPLKLPPLHSAQKDSVEARNLSRNMKSPNAFETESCVLLQADSTTMQISGMNEENQENNLQSSFDA